jgi:uncharacterized protein YjbI with pentapeptide repeats
MELIESHNQCPDCLSMEIQVLPLSESKVEFELYLNCKFHQQQENILDGKIRFGIRGGIFQLSLENAFISEFLSHSNITALKKNEPNSLITNQTWQIRANPKKGILEDNFEKIKLATIKVNQKPYHLEASFVVKTGDISITDIEGLWKHDITPNKHGILERKLADFIYQINLSPYLSKTVFGSSDFSLQPHLFHQQQEKISSQAISKLKKIIEAIYQAKANNLPELAKIAQLNLLTDFCGGNLLGGDLRNIDWSGANLEYVNFRGADLTDADLSEANLSYAKLNGADLSGAYLEGANLHQANFNSASLALANLIAADVTGANFTKTNLTHTSWSNAKVSGAIFGDNIGLTEANKESLTAKGAIFSLP